MKRRKEGEEALLLSLYSDGHKWENAKNASPPPLSFPIPLLESPLNLFLLRDWKDGEEGGGGETSGKRGRRKNYVCEESPKEKEGNRIHFPFFPHFFLF